MNESVGQNECNKAEPGRVGGDSKSNQTCIRQGQAQEFGLWLMGMTQGYQLDHSLSMQLFLNNFLLEHGGLRQVFSPIRNLNFLVLSVVGVHSFMLKSFGLGGWPIRF